MGRIIFLSVALFCWVHVNAQLSSGYIPAQSPKTLVYKITDSEAGKLYRNDKKTVGEEMLHHCVDTLQGIIDTIPDNYSDGHYLLVNALGNNLHFRLASVVPFEHRMLNNQRDMALMVFDRKSGKTITGANVKVGGKRLSFDSKTQSFRRKKTDKQGVLSIEVGGMTAYYFVSRMYNVNWWTRLKSGLWNAPVVKYVSRPVIFVASIPVDTYRSVRHARPVGSIYSIKKPFSDIYYSIRWKEPQGWIDGFVNLFDVNEDSDNGFMVFSKPKYRPGDTIRFKAYVANSKGKPLDDSLNVFIQTDKNHKIGTIKPYRTGFYTMEFVPLADYEMKLDRRYSLYLTNGKVRQSGSFYYEDYELKSVEYHIRAEKEEYLSHEEVVLYAKAVDENNMPVMDARVELTLITDYIKDFNGNMVRVPDMLLNKVITLDPVGETKIVIPDSIWPDASIGVHMTAVFNNSDNQSEHKEVIFVHNNTNESIVAKQHNDSLYIHYEKDGKLTDGIQARIRQGLLGDTLVSLPVRIKIHPLVEVYEVVLAGQAYPRSGNNMFFEQNVTSMDGYQQPFAQFYPSPENSGVSCKMNRLRDSIFITVENPFNLPLSYTIYKGNREQQRGTGKLSTYREKASSKDYFLSVQYIWGGKECQLEYRSANNAAQLQLNSSLPPVVFPGQTVTVNIVATDVSGNPVPNVDLTAWGFTSKFGEYSMPNMPSYQKPPSNRKIHNVFTSAMRPDVKKSEELDFMQWREPLRLDSVELYRFAYPGKAIYQYSFPSADRQTYIAPYLVHEGKMLPVQILYIDDRPVYFGRATTDAPYVFPVVSGVHMIRLRTSNYEVRAKVEISRGQKTIISIDPYQWDRRVEGSDGAISWGSINEMKNKYTSDELHLMRSYLMPIRYRPTGKFAWLQQGSTYKVLTPEKNRYESGYVLPLITNITDGKASVTLWEENKQILTFARDAYEWFEYEPLQGVLKMRTVPFRNHFDYKYPRFDWSTLPYGEHYVDSVSRRWNNDRMRHRIHYTNQARSLQKGHLQIETTLSDSLKNESWCWILYNYAKEETYFYPLSERKFTTQSDGLHALFLFMADRTFYVCDSILLETGTTTMLRLPVEGMSHPPLRIDSYVWPYSLLQDIAVRSGMSVIVPPKTSSRDTMVYNQEYASGVEICGTVTDETGEVVIGVSIIVKGTTVGTLSDVNGNYCIHIPQGYRTLTYSYIGYTTHELTPLQGGYADVVLTEDSQMLDEVVVVGYGVQRRSLLTGSVSFAEPQIMGIVVGVESTSDIHIRGTGSLDAGSQPLYVVNGVVMADISHLDPGSITSMNVLKDAAATSLYGVRAANGVVVITTGGAAVMDAQAMMKQILEDENYQTGLASANGLRTNFSDEAFWQPLLTTDHAGAASFTTTFPDDVTKWNLRFAGLLPGKASAVSQTQVRSFKPLMGQLAVPRFVVENDTANVIGKVINYGSDTVHLNVSFAVDGVAKAEKQADVRHSLIDTLTVIAPEILQVSGEPSGEELFGFYDFADSLAVRYQLTRDDGYQDGEERHIPVVRQGTTETVGEFHVLDTDTTLTISFDANKGFVTLSLESSSLDIMMKETRRLRDYQHLCNEQTASRLKALLLERKAYQLHNKDYPYDEHINSLIERLIKGRNDQGLWGWFGNGVQEVWISTHAVEALLQARDDGFKVGMNFESTTNRLIISFDKASGTERIRLLRLLMYINPESNYSAMFNEIDTSKIRYYTDKLKWMELSLHFDEKPDIQGVLQQQQVDKFGNIHWSESDKQYWRYNDVSVTLAAYRLLRSDGGHDRTLLKIRNYLFAQRNHYGWLNTYETADILATIMPDILTSGDSLGRSQVNISGVYTATVDTFPKHIILHGSEPVVINKRGSFPVYATVWQEVHLRNPEPANEGFRVETKFVVSDDAHKPPYTIQYPGNMAIVSPAVRTADTLEATVSSAILTAGKIATLEATVSSDISSEYVMIEIPIPAGCSYQSKPQSWYWSMGETHREYFRDRVCIYMRNMSKGAHTFRVELMPRYTGTYHVNPAKAERMYTPLYYGRTGMKQVKIY